ncbi:MAG: phenylalanine--tRNA ligase subunit beta, partial [Dehalococcoidia bacterium]|nr:phenylalanine--tRNA ligase subunit beta [Dehalococcoidia bacterium]
NYVMLEYGQPLHAFDYTRLRGGRIVVRRPRPGESITTLDDVKRELAPDMLLICDGEEPVALAGVMGGLDSEVESSTTNVLIESASFNNISIRRTSAALRLRSEASLRFDKGLSPELPMVALRRATQLMFELCGGSAAPGVIDIYPGRRERESIGLTAQKVKRVLGMEMDRAEVARVLGSLGFECRETTGDALSVTPPYWRTDVSIPEDLVEEIARVVGYDVVPTTAISGQIPEYQPYQVRELRERVKDLLVACGWQEAINYTLTSLAQLEKVAPPQELKNSSPKSVANPMSSEQEYLRTTLRAGILATLASNLRHQESSVRIFEAGRVFIPQQDDLPREDERVVGVAWGSSSEGHWSGKPDNLDFYDVKGALETIVEKLGGEASFESSHDPDLMPGRTAKILVDSIEVGVVGEVHPQVTTRFEIESGPVFLFDVDLAALQGITATSRRYRPLTRFPGVIEDLALVVDMDVAADDVRKVIEGNSLVVQANLFDVYTGSQVPQGKKSLAYSVTYQSWERTLSSQDVSQAREEILEQLGREVGADLRG